MQIPKDSSTRVKRIGIGTDTYDLDLCVYSMYIKCMRSLTGFKHAGIIIHLGAILRGIKHCMLVLKFCMSEIKKVVFVTILRTNSTDQSFGIKL
jgi:hypothetical protein